MLQSWLVVILSATCLAYAALVLYLHSTIYLLLNRRPRRLLTALQAASVVAWTVVTAVWLAHAILGH